MTGFIRRDGAGITGELIDAFGYVIQITGTPAVLDGQSVYTLTGRLRIPEHLKIPLVDDEARS